MVHKLDFFLIVLLIDIQESVTSFHFYPYTIKSYMLEVDYSMA